MLAEAVEGNGTGSDGDGDEIPQTPRCAEGAAGHTAQQREHATGVPQEARRAHRDQIEGAAGCRKEATRQQVLLILL